MILGKKIIVVMPAYNAEKTLLKTFKEIPQEIVDKIILTDDFSQDKTLSIAKELGLEIFCHKKNVGYGGNQKTCYKKALALGADIIIMLHPDYQYDPKLIKPMAELIASGEYDIVLGSRILARGAVKAGMPVYKYLANRILTFIQNFVFGLNLSEYHTGYRAFRKEIFEKINFEKNSDDFIFDNQLLSQAVYLNFKIGEIACPARYTPESSSVDFLKSIKYGLGVLWTSLIFVLQKNKRVQFKIFN